MTANSPSAKLPRRPSEGRTTLLIVGGIIALVAVLVALAMCSDGQPQQPVAEQPVTDQSASEPTPTAEPPAPGEEPVYTPTYKPNGTEVAVVQVSRAGQPVGTVKFSFYPEDAPNHVAAFVELAKKGFYDGTKFHRVEPNFVVQGGDPYSKTNEGPAGTGGPGYRLKAEFNSRKHLDGTVAMARSTDPDSAGSQFYICLGAQSFLDGQYTVFGQVTEGMDVVRQIKVGDVMQSVTIENAN